MPTAVDEITVLHDGMRIPSQVAWGAKPTPAKCRISRLVQQLDADDRCRFPGLEFAALESRWTAVTGDSLVGFGQYVYAVHFDN